MKLLILVATLLTIYGCNAASAEEAQRAKVYCAQNGMNMTARVGDDQRVYQLYCQVPGTDAKFDIPSSVLKG